MADYYKTLGVEKTASQDEIKKAFRKKAHELHPDKKTGDEAKFKEVNEAYQVLSDKEKRAQYDQFGQGFNSQGTGGFGGGQGGFGGFQGGFSQGGFDFSGVDFEDIFGGMFGGGGRRSAQKTGRDIQVDMDISFKEMVEGVQKSVTVRRLATCKTCDGSGGKPGSKSETCKTCDGSGVVRKTMQTILGTFQQTATCDVCHGRGITYAEKCPTCHGEGRTHQEETIAVDVPAGIADGQMLSLAGKGEAGEHGAPAGDLIVVIHVRPEKGWTRRGNDILAEQAISVSLASLGGKIEVETVEGKVTMKIPAGTQPGEVFRLRGKGVPSLRGMGRGDQLVTVKVVIPKKLSRTAKKALETLEQEGV